MDQRHRALIGGGIVMGNAAAFVPTDIAGLTLWLRADDISGNDGDALAAWNDKTANGNNVAQATAEKKPLLKKGTNGFFGHNTVLFDGSNDLLVGSNFLSGAAGTVYAVFRLNAIQDYETVLGSADEGTVAKYAVICYAIDQNIANNKRLKIFQSNNDTADTVVGSTTLVVGAVNRAMWKSDGSAYSMRLNGTAQTLSAPSGSNAGDWYGDTNLRDNVTVGGAKWNAEAQFLSGDLAELLVYNTALSEAQDAQVVAYLDARYAVPYFTLGAATQVIAERQSWQTGDPHTLSVIEMNSGGFKYWGYLGQEPYPAGGPVGLMRSNDLLSWTDYASNPLETGRWPSVVKVGSAIYMTLTKYSVETELQSIQLLSSTDGLSFTPVKTIVAEQAGYNNDGSFLYYNPNDSKYYLYWVNIQATPKHHHICVRSATDPADLDTADTVVVVSALTTETIAAPSMMYWDGLYYLTIEKDPTLTWITSAYASSGCTAGFLECGNSPFLTSDDACLFQHIFGGVLHVFYSEKAGGAWTMYHRQATLP